jgi:hypothetical protein
LFTIGPVVFAPRNQTYATELKKWTIVVNWSRMRVPARRQSPNLTRKGTHLRSQRLTSFNSNLIILKIGNLILDAGVCRMRLKGDKGTSPHVCVSSHKCTGAHFTINRPWEQYRRRNLTCHLKMAAGGRVFMCMLFFDFPNPHYRFEFASGFCRKFILSSTRILRISEARIHWEWRVRACSCQPRFGFVVSFCCGCYDHLLQRSYFGEKIWNLSAERLVIDSSASTKDNIGSPDK